MKMRENDQPSLDEVTKNTFNRQHYRNCR